VVIRPLALTYPYALIFWPVFFGAFVPEMLLVRRWQKKAADQDAGSLKAIKLSNNLALVLAILAVFFVPGATITHRFAAFWTGTALLAAGSLLRRHCWRVLGQNFTGAVVVNPDQPVIERGAYRFVRHPSYTGGAMMFAGVGLAFGNWISFALLVIGICASYVYRVRVEERALVATLGEPYRDYMRRRKRFIPWVV
jgi:protein-S-isoprenylcysteine O-methyltransferase Ste14